MLTKEQIGEIRTAYRDAKDQKKQIGILADLYACDKAEIRQVLGIEDAPPQAPLADQPDQPTPKKRVVKSYDQAVRKQLVKAVLLDGESTTAVCERMGVPAGTAAKWLADARKKQAEFLAYDPKSEDPAAKEQKTAPEHPKSVTHHRTPGLDPGVILRELQTGVEGLQTFVDNFAGVDIFEDDQWVMLDIILAKAEGFAAGMDTAIQLRGGTTDEMDH